MPASKINNSSIAARIREARQMAQLEPADMRAALAKHGISLSKGGLHRLENVEPKNPNIEIIEAIASITGASPSWILFGEGPALKEERVGGTIRHRVIDTIELMGKALDMNARQEKQLDSWLESMRSSRPQKVKKP